jgi:2-dehydro-3-deoxy-D-arabinonate dehydratase
MHLYHTTSGALLHNENKFYLIGEDWDALINRSHLHDYLTQLAKSVLPDNEEQARETIAKNNLPPLKSQEVWAAGVTYLRSREARMEEAKEAGGGDFYARVYNAERPELFFKSTAARAVGHGQAVRIRKDSTWNVPEPELTLFISSSGSIEGYTIGNDMSSRDIEGENPLYLPQAKTYDASAALGPCLYVPPGGIHPDAIIQLLINREGKAVFEGQVSINRMKRQHTELAAYLFRETSFPFGVYLMTGTGIVPPDDFSLQVGDEISIQIEGIGTLKNTVDRQ